MSEGVLQDIVQSLLNKGGNHIPEEDIPYDKTGTTDQDLVLIKDQDCADTQYNK